jgi:hypothetical protein
MNLTVKQKTKSDAKPAHITKEAVATQGGKEPRAKRDGRKLKYDRDQLIQL